MGKKRRRELRLKKRTTPGMAPGTLMVSAKARRPEIRLMVYGPKRCEELTIVEVPRIARYLDGEDKLWLSVEGLGDEQTLVQLQKLFGWHRLAMEDVVNVHQRAKVEAYEKHLFIVSRMATPSESNRTEQLSLFLGDNVLVSFRERAGDCFDPVRERIRAGHGRIRSAGVDYLAYALLDMTIDGYFPVLETYGERLEALEERVLERPVDAQMATIHDFKHELMELRRAIWPFREAVRALERDENQLVTDETRVYLRDCYDHVVQLMDLIETYREVAADVRDLYLSSISNRMNETMRVLTVMATVFIPLSFITGVYGMNFHEASSPWSMPELSWYFGYPAALGLMATVAAGQFLFFWRKGWLGKRRQERRELRAGETAAVKAK